MAKKTKRKKLPVILAVLSIFVAAEVFGLLWLKWSVNHNKAFWDRKSKETGQLTYLALGDSAAQGIGASSPMRGYVGVIAKRYAAKTGQTVRIINPSKTGATVQDVLDEQVSVIKATKADLVTIEVGANDVTRTEPEVFRLRFRELLGYLPDGTYVSNMPLFNSRRNRTEPAKTLTKVIEEELKNFPKLVLVDLQKQTTEHQSIFGFAPDLFHPNNISYKNWADAFWLQIDKK